MLSSGDARASDLGMKHSDVLGSELGLSSNLGPGYLGSYVTRLASTFTETSDAYLEEMRRDQSLEVSREAAVGGRRGPCLPEPLGGHQVALS